eukprot:5302151-Prymnesium_polylepis.1
MSCKAVTSQEVCRKNHSAAPSRGQMVHIMDQHQMRCAAYGQWGTQSLRCNGWGNGRAWWRESRAHSKHTESERLIHIFKRTRDRGYIMRHIHTGGAAQSMSKQITKIER